MSDAGDDAEENDRIDPPGASRPPQARLGVSYYLDMPLDVYGDAMMSMITAADVHRKHLKREPHIGLWVFTSAYVILLNYSFQIGFACMVHFDVRRAWANGYGSEARLRQLTLQIEQAEHELPEGSAAVALCSRNDVRFLQGYFMVILLWYARIIIEFSEAFWLLFVVLNSPKFIPDSANASIPRKEGDAASFISSDSELGEEGVAEDALLYTDGERYWVRHIPEWLRWSILGIIVIPKIFVAVWVGFIGSEFLLMTDHASNLVLKVLTCAYFVSIDELLFKAFISVVKQNRINRTSIACTSITSDWWSNWGSSAFRMFVAVGFTIVTSRYLFPGVMEMRYACKAYGDRFPDTGVF